MVSRPLFLQALRVTTIYVLVHVLGIQVVAFALAVFLNQKLYGISISRTLFYMPRVTASVATAFPEAEAVTSSRCGKLGGEGAFQLARKEKETWHAPPTSR